MSADTVADLATSGVALIYTRVSGPGQERDGESLETQEEDCRALAARLGYTVGAVVREVFRGVELFDRPQLSQVRVDVRAGRYAALLMHHPDRLARSPVHQAIVIEEATRAGVRVEFVHEPLDTSPEGLLIAYVRGYSAQIQRERIREMSLGGKLHRLKSGKITRAGHDLYGTRRDHEAGVRVVYEPEAQVVVHIYEMCAYERLGLNAIARRLYEEGIDPPFADRVRYRDGRVPRWGSASVRLMLRNPAYRGETTAMLWQSYVVPPDPTRPHRAQYHSKRRPPEDAIRLPEGVTPAIVSEELWYQAQRVLDTHAARFQTNETRQHQNAKPPFLLRGAITCGICGRQLHAFTDYAGKRNRRYRCGSNHTVTGACGARQIHADAIEAWVWGEVTALLLAHPALASQETHTAGQSKTQAGQASTQERGAIQEHIARLDRLRARTLARYNTIDDETVFPWSLVESELTRLERERARHLYRLAEMDAAELRASATVLRRQRLLEWLASLQSPSATLSATLTESNLATTLADLTTEQRRKVLESLDTHVSGSGAQWGFWCRLWLTTDETAEDATTADGIADGDGSIVTRFHPEPPRQVTRAMQRDAARQARQTRAQQPD